MLTYKIYFYSFLSLLFVTSCTDLTESPKSVVTESFLNTATGFERAVNAAYQTSRNFYGRERGFNVTTFGTDTYREGADGGFKFFNRYSADFDSRSGGLQEIWSEFYEGINTTNIVIDRAPNVGDVDEALKTQRVAEARFLRAFFYFHLVRLWGDVPLKLSETTEISTEVIRDPAEAVYDAIISDLNIAVNDLASKVDQPQVGRATKEAAQHLLALVHLTRGESSDWAIAADNAIDVIESGNFSLLDRYGDIFIPGNERNDEVVWSVQYSADPIANAQGNRSHLYFIMTYDEPAGMRRVIENGRPWKRCRPTKFLANLYGENDTRWEDSFKTYYASNDEGSIPTGSNGEKLWALGDTAVWVPRRVVTQEEKDSRPPILIRGIDEWTGRSFPTLTKHIDPNRDSTNDPSGIRDFQLFRLAETYLIAAEALMQDGRLDDAVQYFNVVRRRAAEPGFEAELEITAAELDIDMILDERARELAGEGRRWFDLVRTGKLLERVRAYNEDAAPNIQEKHFLRPIPQDEIDRATNEVGQNPGW